MNDIREPMQKRSIEKKEKIIKSGFDLILNKGYYNTNTKEIAKAAGVSTGIIYQYFRDKHDIFIAGLEKYADKVFFPTLKINDYSVLNIIEKYINSHKLTQIAHEEIMSMVHNDNIVAEIYHKRELDSSMWLSNVLNISLEKAHIILGIIDNLCHEIIYHKHNNLNYDYMKEEVINIINNIID